jgi:chemotaxis signal transduction protein
VKGFATEESYHRRGGRQAIYQREVLAFALCGEEYGIDILRLREIIRTRPITEVPRAPSFVLGVIGVRGEVLPVIDLRLRLRLRHPRPPARWCACARRRSRPARRCSGPARSSSSQA